MNRPPITDKRMAGLRLMADFVRESCTEGQYTSLGVKGQPIDEVQAAIDYIAELGAWMDSRKQYSRDNS